MMGTAEPMIARMVREAVENARGRLAHGLSLGDGCRNCVCNVRGVCEAGDERCHVSTIKGGWCILWERA